MNVLQAIEKFGAAALKDIELPVNVVDKTFLLLNTGASDAGEIETVVKTLISKALIIGTDGAAAISSDGLNVPADLKVLSEGKDIFDYVRSTVVPTVEKVWAGLSGAAKNVASSAPASGLVASAAPVVSAAAPAPQHSEQFASVEHGPSAAPSTTVLAAAEAAALDAQAGPGLHLTTKP